MILGIQRNNLSVVSDVISIVIDSRDPFTQGEKQFVGAATPRKIL